MPITTARPGIFRGRRDNRDGWYVVAGSEPERRDRENAWRENFATTNRPRWQRVVKVVVVVGVGLISLLVASTVGSLLLSAIDDAPIRSGVTFPVFFVALIATVAGLAGGGLLASKVFPYGTPPLGNIPGVHRIPDEVAAWATDDTEIEVVSDLSRTLDRVRQVATLLLFPAEPVEGMDREWVIEDVVTPILREQMASLHGELVEVAERVGFPVPELEIPASPAA